MDDLIARLRRWTHAVDAVAASDLMDEAADEIERLLLTDAEREAVQASAWEADGWLLPEHAATLRGLLERLTDEKGTAEPSAASAGSLA